MTETPKQKLNAKDLSDKILEHTHCSTWKISVAELNRRSLERCKKIRESLERENPVCVKDDKPPEPIFDKEEFMKNHSLRAKWERKPIGEGRV